MPTTTPTSVTRPLDDEALAEIAEEVAAEEAEREAEAEAAPTEPEAGAEEKQ